MEVFCQNLDKKQNTHNTIKFMKSNKRLFDQFGLPYYSQANVIGLEK